MNLNPTEKNAIDALDMLLQLSKVRVTRRTLREKLWQHPDFPSLVSLADTLEELTVKNLAINVSSERLADIPLPALAYMNIDGGMFALVRSVKSDTIEWLHTKRGWQRQPLYEFSQQWNGVALLIEPNRQSGEVNYEKQRRQERIENSRYPVIIAGLFVILGLFLTYAFQSVPLSVKSPVYALLGLKLLGTIISSLLIAYALNSVNPLLRGVCQLGYRTNCNSVLNSGAAKVFSWLSWAEVGFLYFTGGLIATGLSLFVPAIPVVPVLMLLNAFSLPYTLYSFYYQGYIAKEWCILCTTVQLILWAECLVGSQLWGFTNAAGLGFVFISFVLAIVIWAFIKQPLWAAGQVTQLQRELQRLKFNPDYVEAIVHKQRTMPPIINEMGVLVLGNSVAAHTLTMVTNPVCRPCANAHREIEELLHNAPDLFRVEIVFVAQNDAESLTGRVARRLVSLPAQTVASALHQWYANEKRDVVEWSKQIRMEEEDMEARNRIGLHQRWCELAQVTHTPTLFLNGSELPATYKIGELSLLCKSLARQNEPLLT